MSQIFHQLVLSVVLLGAFALQVHPQHQPTGFISIDCGLPENSSYKEVTIGITFNSDAAFIDTGESKLLPAANHNYQPYLHVRSFPNGMRNCYRINVTSGTKYLIRASFFYGNYDGVPDKLPEFELHLGTNLWDSVRFVTALDKIVKELIHVPLRNYIHVCLVNTGSGVPFISAIELRPLPNTVYNQTHTGSLALLLRYDTRQATPNFTVYRYPDDIHDRFWYPYFGDYWTQLSTSSTNFSQSDNDYQPPLVVMSTAATPSDIADSLIISWPSTIV